MKKALLLCLVVFLGLVSVTSATDAKVYTDAVAALAKTETDAQTAYDKALKTYLADAGNSADKDKKTAAEADNADANTKKAWTDALAAAQAKKPLKEPWDALEAAKAAKSKGPVCVAALESYKTTKCKDKLSASTLTADVPADLDKALALTKGKECVDLKGAGATAVTDLKSVKVTASALQADGSCKVTVANFKDAACATAATTDATADIAVPTGAGACVKNPFSPGFFANVTVSSPVETKATTPTAGGKAKNETKNASANASNASNNTSAEKEGGGAGMYILIAVIVVVVCAAGFFAYKKFGAAKTE